MRSCRTRSRPGSRSGNSSPAACLAQTLVQPTFNMDGQMGVLLVLALLGLSPRREITVGLQEVSKPPPPGLSGGSDFCQWTDAPSGRGLTKQIHLVSYGSDPAAPAALSGQQCSLGRRSTLASVFLGVRARSLLVAAVLAAASRILECAALLGAAWCAPLKANWGRDVRS